MFCFLKIATSGYWYGNMLIILGSPQLVFSVTDFQMVYDLTILNEHHFCSFLGPEMIFAWTGIGWGKTTFLNFLKSPFHWYIIKPYLYNTYFGHFWGRGKNRVEQVKFFWSYNTPLVVGNYCICYERIHLSSFAKKI